MKRSFETKKRMGINFTIIATIILIFMTVATISTFAYFTAKTRAENENWRFGYLTANAVDFGYTQIDGDELDENGVSTVNSLISLSNLIPGQTITFNGKMEINADIDIFVRYRMDINITLGERVEQQIRARATEVGANPDIEVLNRIEELRLEMRSYIFQNGNTVYLSGGNDMWLDENGKKPGEIISGASKVASSSWLYYPAQINQDLSSLDYISAGTGASYVFTVVDFSGSGEGVEHFTSYNVKRLAKGAS